MKKLWVLKVVAGIFVTYGFFGFLVSLISSKIVFLKRSLMLQKAEFSQLNQLLLTLLLFIFNCMIRHLKHPKKVILFESTIWP